MERKLLWVEGRQREWLGIVRDEESHVNHSFLVHSIIDIAAVTAHLLISLLFTENCNLKT